VYGKLKRVHNPNGQRVLQFRNADHHERVLAESDFWLTIQSKIKKAKSAESLRALIGKYDERGIKSSLFRGLIERDIAARARVLKLTKVKESVVADERIVRLLRKGTLNPGPARKLNRPPAKKSKTKAKKSASKGAPKHIILRSPKVMPDPGPCAWLGSIVEWSWEIPRGHKAKNVDENGNALWDPNSEWMFLWSPKYKAVISIRRPRNMYRLADVSRYGGAAKMFETFMARPAEKTFEMTVPDVPIHKVGRKAAHIVYRSNKWSPKRMDTDYIHPFEKGVQLYCGPSIERPEVFICFGGKLTMTKRGLVW